MLQVSISVYIYIFLIHSQRYIEVEYITLEFNQKFVYKGKIRTETFVAYTLKISKTSHQNERYIRVAIAFRNVINISTQNDRLSKQIHN